MATKRNTTLDVARGFTVFIMPAVHSVLYYGNAQTRRSWLGKVLGFLAEGPGAQLFMFLMGTSITLGRKKKTPEVLKRATGLLAQGFLLNVLRLVLPYRIGLIPEELLQDAGITREPGKLRRLLLTGDILQSASLCYLVAAWLYGRGNYAGKAITGALLIAFVSPTMWDRGSSHRLLSYFLKLATGKPPEVFFPVFPWLAYTLAGLAWGHYLKTHSKKRLYGKSALAGVILVILGKYLRRHEPSIWETDFYRLGPGGTFLHLGVVLLWLYLCHVTVKRVRWNRFFKLLLRLSRRITRVYFIQWITVLWLLPLFGYRRSKVVKSIVSMVVNTALTIKITKLNKPLIWKRSTISQVSA